MDEYKTILTTEYNVSMKNAALTVAWIVGLVYSTVPTLWLAVHPFVEEWRARRGKIYPLLGLIWMAMVVVLGLITWRWRFAQAYKTPWSIVVGGLLLAIAFGFYGKIGKSFGRDRLLGKMEVQPQQHEQKLITTGLHARMRHPIYLAHLVSLSGLTVASGLSVMFGLWMFAIITGAFMIRAEDAELEKRFGEEYRHYRNRVPAVLPF